MTSSSGNTDLVETTDNTLTIPTLASGSYSSPSDFPANHWGYKKDSGSYIPFATNTTILESNTYANDDTTTLSFATKIDYLQASGTYKTTLVFTTTANPLTPYIQNLDPTLCTTTPLTVLDKRDGEEYTVQRLADGNCWMIGDLMLGKTTLTTDLTSDNTNLSTTIDAATFNNWKKTAGTGSYTNAEFMYEYGIDPVSQGSFGTLYNFCAASAGTICVSSNSSNASSDLCPAGWRLPTGGNSGEFKNLYSFSAYNSSAKLRTPVSSGGIAFNLSGSFLSGSLSQRNTYGYYWSSTMQTYTRMYEFYIDASDADPATTKYSWANRQYGFPIRCIAK